MKKHIISYDRNGFIINGKREFLIGGEFHYFRVPSALWEDRLKKMKSMGANLISVYIPWSMHEPVENQVRWDGDYDLDRFLTLCEQYGFYILIKPGPYVCAELDFGGHPDWLIGKIAKKEFRLRMLDEGYLNLCKRWYKMVNEKINKHLITNGGRIIAIQIENEYDHLIQYGEETITTEDAIKYFLFLRDTMDELGIDIPKFANEATFLRSEGIIDTRTFYPYIPGLWMNEYDLFEGKIIESRKTQSTYPVMILELQAGWFAQIGVPIFEPDLHVVEGVSKSVLIHGASVMNYYMMVGGTTFPYMGARGDIFFLGGLGNITSYDFGGAPVREWGELHNEKYYWIKGFIRFAREFSDIILNGDDQSYVKVISAGENVAVMKKDGAFIDHDLTQSDENCDVFEQGNENGRFFMIRNLENDNKNFALHIPARLAGKDYTFSTKVLAGETRLLPINFTIPGTDTVIRYATSEALFSRKYEKGTVFALSGKKDVAGQLVINRKSQDIKVIRGNVEVFDFGDESMLKYDHNDVNIIKISDIYLFIVENSLVGRVEDLEQGILIHSAYYIESIVEADGKISLSTEIKENSENRFRFFPMTEAFRPGCLYVNGGAVALGYCAETGMYEGSFSVGTHLGRPEFEWTSNWKYTSDTDEASGDYDHSGWEKLARPMSLEEAGYIEHGYYWYRTEFELKKEPGMVFMDYEHNDTDRMFIYINGKLVYKSHNRKIKQMDITSALKKGKNIMAILYANEFHNKSHPHEGEIVKFSGIMRPFELYGTYSDNRKFRLTLKEFYVKQGLEGINKGYHRLEFDDSGWNECPPAQKYVPAPEMGHIVWFRRKFRYNTGHGFSAPIRLRIEEADKRLTIYVNGKAVALYDILGPQQDFYIPESFINMNGENVISIILECPGFYDELQSGYRRGYLIEPGVKQVYVARKTDITIS